jgi:hypothetical protein
MPHLLQSRLRSPEQRSTRVYVGLSEMRPNTRGMDLRRRPGKRAARVCGESRVTYAGRGDPDPTTPAPYTEFFPARLSITADVVACWRLSRRTQHDSRPNKQVLPARHRPDDSHPCGRRFPGSCKVNARSQFFRAQVIETCRDRSKSLSSSSVSTFGCGLFVGNTSRLTETRSGSMFDCSIATAETRVVPIKNPFGLRCRSCGKPGSARTLICRSPYSAADNVNSSTISFAKSEISKRMIPETPFGSCFCFFRRIDRSRKYVWSGSNRYR